MTAGLKPNLYKSIIVTHVGNETSAKPLVSLPFIVFGRQGSPLSRQDSVGKNMGN